MTTHRTRFEEAGLRRYRAKLDAIPDRVRHKIRGALEKSGRDLVTTMKQLAPVDQGNLVDTIEFFFPEQRPGEDQSVRGEQLSLKGSMGLAILVVAGSSSQSGEDGYYAKFVEFGHSGDGGHVPASPFFYPAYRFRRTSIRGRIVREMNKAMRDVAGDGN